MTCFLKVDSSFTNFKNDMETTLQAIVKNMQDGSQRIDDKVMNCKYNVIAKMLGVYLFSNNLTPELNSLD